MTASFLCPQVNNFYSLHSFKTLKILSHFWWREVRTFLRTGGGGFKDCGDTRRRGGRCHKGSNLTDIFYVWPQIQLCLCVNTLPVSFDTLGMAESTTTKLLRHILVLIRNVPINRHIWFGLVNKLLHYDCIGFLWIWSLLIIHMMYVYIKKK